jgi:nucleoside-diphosphate kinase
VALERTLFIVKPDAVQRSLTGRILAHVEERGFRIVEARMGRIGREEAETFYEEHRAKPFFKDLADYMTSGPVMLTCLERDNGVAYLREVVGATDPAQAAPDTIRKIFGQSKQMNSVHASDSLPSAERELKIFFGVAAPAR